MTRRDDAEYTAVGFDLDYARERERDNATTCWCGRPTWHIAARCDSHYEPPPAVVGRRYHDMVIDLD